MKLGETERLHGQEASNYSITGKKGSCMGGVLDMSYQKELLERIYLSAGLGTPP